MINKRLTISDIMKYKQRRREEYARMASISVSHIKKIKNHYSTKEIFYPEYKEAYDYIDELFPDANIKSVSVFVTNRKYLDELGYSAVRGFFNRIEKVVVLPNTEDIESPKSEGVWSNIVAKTTQDETIVHEFLHYVSSMLPRPPTSTDLEEEFAYGYSVGYLKKKGYTDREIIKNTFMPYIISNVIDRRKIMKEFLVKEGIDLEEFKMLSDKRRNEITSKISQKKEVYDAMVEAAYEKGQQIIDVYSRKKIYKQDDEVSETEYDFLDF